MLKAPTDLSREADLEMAMDLLMDETKARTREAATMPFLADFEDDEGTLPVERCAQD